GGNPIVYYGFSAGTGSLSNIHRVCIGPPQVVKMDDVTVCDGESVDLQADENGIAWHWNPNSTLFPLDVSDPTASPTMTTTYYVTIDYACGYTDHDTVTVFVNPLPDPTADNSGPVCPGDPVQLFATGGAMYHWTGPMSFNSFLQNPIINNVTVAKTGTYTVTVTDAAGCTNTATTNVQLYPLPMVNLDPLPAPLCEDGDPVQLTADPNGGDWSGSVSPTGVFDPSAVGEGTYVITYTVTDGNGCTNSDQITIDVVPNIPAVITPPGPFCVTEAVVTLQADPSGGTWGDAANSDGEIYPATLGVGLHLVSYEWAGPNECANTQFFIQVVAAPVVNITDIAPLCMNDPIQTLLASPPGGTWSGAADNNGQVDPSSLPPGIHEVYYTFMSGNGCTDTDTSEITILPAAPQVTNLTITCDSLATAYIVTFNITGGDPSTYSVMGAAGGNLIPGNPYSFVSQSVPSGGGYNFTVDDGNHCSPTNLTGSYSCLCATNAGAMDITPLNLCQDDTASLLMPTGIVLEPDDTIIYILHTGDPDSILEVVNPNQIVFGPPLQYGVTYFISAVVGNAITGVGVDFNDPCLSVTAGKPITWTALPDAVLSGPSMICTGDSAALVFNLSGVGPYDVLYTDGTNVFVLDSISTGYVQIVHPVLATTYSLLAITDQSGPGCANVLDTGLTIQVSDIIHAMQVLMMCQGDSAFLQGAWQFSQGVFFDTVPGIIGCDTLLESYLIVHGPDTTHLIATTCDAAQAGIFQTLLSNQFGCDSTIINTVTFIPADTTHLNSTTCDPQIAGMHIQIFIGQSGCDSLVIENIALLESDTTYLSSGNCDPAATGTFTQVLTNSDGCDSTIIETVFLLRSDTTNLTSASCNPADTGIMITVLQNALGCDSTVIEGIALSPSYQLTDTTLTCDPASAGVFTNHLFTQSGCDSVITTVVSLLPSDTLISFGYSCLPVDTGTVESHFVNEFGCDSLVRVITLLSNDDTCHMVQISRDLYIPNVFSPNGDGINDYFLVFADPNAKTRINYFRVFDRWGNEVFERKDFLPNDDASGWDGRLEGKLLNPGVFVWAMEALYEDGRKEALYGDVTLIR
ncbi:MAG TPA: gliding motility-associated C-terminal domain-containing protein, partial [Saprospiraceae bacterium]|nr:gliding motility-associated C-terminal domain-containing protein [Saprospiraceae bacterium]